MSCNHESGGCINATAMCKRVGKLSAHYMRLAGNKELLEEAERSMGIPIIELVVSKVGNIPIEERGTWIHLDLAVNFAQWLSSTSA
jgi:hypothetical protein